METARKRKVGVVVGYCFCMYPTCEEQMLRLDMNNKYGTEDDEEKMLLWRIQCGSFTKHLTD